MPATPFHRRGYVRLAEHGTDVIDAPRRLFDTEAAASPEVLRRYGGWWEEEWTAITQ
jgi:hypothetical protein